MLNLFGWEDEGMAFDSAWDPPVPVFMELSKNFPNEKIVLEYADEDLYGPNRGTIVFMNGEIIDEKEIGIEDAKEIWGYEELEEEPEM